MLCSYKKRCPTTACTGSPINPAPGDAERWASHEVGMKEATTINGIVKCVKNAENLIEAAQTLFAENRPVGGALLVTAIEEYGKASLIIAHFNGIVTEKRFHRAFRSHMHKRAYGGLIGLIGTAVVDGSKEAVKFRKLLGRLDFDVVRDAVLYVDYHKKKFVAPPEDLPSFARVLRLALRLKRIFAVLSDEDACAEVLKDTWDPKSSKNGRYKFIDRLLRMPHT